MLTRALFPHQGEAANWLTNRPMGILGLEMRLGKTRTVIEAAERLYRAGHINRVLSVSPAAVRGVWADPDPAMGQIAQYSTVPVVVDEYAVRRRTWNNFGALNLNAPGARLPERALLWTVTNYEFVRVAARLGALLAACDARTVLVLDESQAVANYRSQQARACHKLAARCGRRWLLTGTPSGDNPEDIFGQFYALDWRIVGCKYVSEFRARHAVMNPYGYKVRGRAVEVLRWVNLEDLAKRTAPFVLRRTMDQVFRDLPPRLAPTALEVPLGADAWRIYKQMKRDAVAWLSDNRAATAAQAGVKVLRLAQITSGFLGGVEDEDGAESGVQEVGREKLDAVVAWVRERLVERPGFKAIVWCRFRAEAERASRVLGAELGIPTALLYGGQKREARDATLRLMHPATAPEGPAVVCGTPRTGALGLNLAAASDVLYPSNDWSLLTRDQADARILGPDQRRPASYTDVLATGPKGEHTVDHVVVRALRAKRDVASLTADAWLKELAE